MASLGDYQLCWADVRGASDGSDEGNAAHQDQYVFASRVELPMNLRRVRAAQDLVLALSGGDNLAAERFAVAGVALVAGNLLATGRWLWLLCSILSLLLCGVLAWWKSAIALAALQALPLIASMSHGNFGSVEWLATETTVVAGSLAVLAAVLHATQEDPRSYALLRERSDFAVRLRNDCCMDVKLLVFNGEDAVRMVPHGGLLGGSLVPRGETFLVGEAPPYIVKVYAPFEKELGLYHVPGGLYSLRATAPPVLLVPPSTRGGAGQAGDASTTATTAATTITTTTTTTTTTSFTNNSEVPVCVSIGRKQCWTNSLWLPLAPFFARMLRGTELVAPAGKLTLSGEPSVLRVYPAGIVGSFVELACCSLNTGEGVEYLGGIKWSCPRKAPFKKSASSLLKTIR